MRRVRKILLLLLVLTPLWFLAFSYLQDAIYGRSAYRAVVLELKSNPTFVELLETNGLSKFDAGPNAHVSFDGTEGHYSFRVVNESLSVDKIIGNAGFRFPNPFTTTKKEFKSLSRPPSANDIVFRVDWQEPIPNSTEIVRITLQGKELYKHRNLGS